jgi:hypothetical protein
MTAGTLLGSFAVPPPPVVSSLGHYGHGVFLTCIAASAPASAVWATAKRVIYIPIFLPFPVTTTSFWWMNGVTVGTDSFDCGIYSAVGGLPVTKLASSGSTLSAGASVVQSVAVAVSLGAGSYFLAISCSGTTATLYQVSGGVAFPDLKTTGICEEITGSFGLPTTATPVVVSQNRTPLCGFATVATL